MHSTSQTGFKDRIIAESLQRELMSASAPVTALASPCVNVWYAHIKVVHSNISALASDSVVNLYWLMPLCRSELNWTNQTVFHIDVHSIALNDHFVARCSAIILSRCLWNLIGTHMWQIELIGHDSGKAHTCVNKAPQSVSNSKTTKSKELSVDLLGKTVVRHRSGHKATLRHLVSSGDGDNHEME